jgi:ribosomal protein L11 methyltransferase
MSPARTRALETVSVEVPEHALEAYEAALAATCLSVAFFPVEASASWRLEAVRAIDQDAAPLTGALAIAALTSGFAAEAERRPVEADGWLERSYDAFPEQSIGRRFLIRGSHLPVSTMSGKIALRLDAGPAFGSGEHGSTRGCLRALETIAYRRPRSVLDLGTGSGILAVAAARLLRRRIVATDIEPLSIREARRNAVRNGVGRLVSPHLANGWNSRPVLSAAPYDLVLTNIFARPLARMASALATHLAPGGTAILAGLLRRQARFVIAAHRRVGLRVERVLTEGDWATIVMRAPRAVQGQRGR